MASDPGKQAAPSLAGVALAGLILVMLPAMVVAAGGAVFSTALPTTPPQNVRAWIQHYKMFVGSAVMTVIAAATYTELHFSLPP